MNDRTLLYRVYGGAHRIAKRLARQADGQGAPQLVHIYNASDLRRFESTIGPARHPVMVNDVEVATPESIEPGQVFYGENAVLGLPRFDSRPPAVEMQLATFGSPWRMMVESARVPDGWRNSGYYLVGFVREPGQWCLSSWIWASAAVARYFSGVGEIDQVLRIADAFVRDQLSCGAWVVRFDYVAGRAVPIIAPNDSAYIAENALLSAFGVTGDGKYLRAAEACAAWIIETSRPDGLVYFGRDGLTGHWIADKNIVDIGFTAGLFCRLYAITDNPRYLEFARRFVHSYARVFFDRGYGAFWTSVDAEDRPRGGHFARGQAWALEGLMAYYRVSGAREIRDLVDKVMSRLVRAQSPSGAWPYNLSRPLMGEDCKGTPVLARCLMEWHEVSGRDELRESARRALQWCEQHTVLTGQCPGGIFSYSVEGAVGHTMYSETAFTYACTHAMEARSLLGRALA